MLAVRRVTQKKTEGKRQHVLTEKLVLIRRETVISELFRYKNKSKTIEDGTDRLSSKVGEKLPPLAA